jgi:hypothetical protein
MGEVYRARDRLLRREVAIKVFPARPRLTPEELRRFEREARAAGAVQHANVVAVFDAGRHGGRPFVVFERLEGRTLRDEMAAGRLPPGRAIEQALQIARGLAAAHERGIVHRDVKPENVFVTSEGHIKVLDFGLAKMIDAGAQSALSATSRGVLLGTAGYMAPEQARGGPVDVRADVFAFGALLCEMVTGRAAFRGASPAEVLSAVLRDDPLETADLPPALGRLLRHCLAKDPAARFQSMRDVSFALEAVLEGTASAPSRPRATARDRPQRDAGAPATPEFTRLTYRCGELRAARFTPDGRTVVYAAAWDGNPVEVFTVRPGGVEARPLGLANAEVRAVSRSEELALLQQTRRPRLFMALGRLARAPLSGGSPRPVLDDACEADFAPDGTLAVVREVGDRQRVEFPVDRVLYETSGWVSDLRVSPRGDGVAFLDHPVRGDDAGVPTLMDRSGRRNPLGPAFTSALGLAFGERDELWVTAAHEGMLRALWAVSPHGARRLLYRAPVALTLHDVAGGRALLTTEHWRVRMFASRAGGPEREMVSLDNAFPTALSDDGRVLVFNETGDAGGARYACYLGRTDGTAQALRLGDGFGAGLTRDGAWVIGVTHTAPRQLVRFPTGPGQPNVLTRDGVARDTARWLRDAESAVFSGRVRGGPPRIFAQDVRGGRPRPLSPRGVAFRRFFRASPDGRMVAAQAADGSVWLCPLRGRPARLPGEGGAPVGWSRDGRALFLAGLEALPTPVERVDVATGRRRLWRTIAPADRTGVARLSTIVVGADGKSYAYSYWQVLSVLFLASGVTKPDLAQP